MSKKDYDRSKAKAYMDSYAMTSNPAYYDYSRLGGDCTNFASQVICAGSNNTMNEKLWYYTASNKKSPSWTGVDYLYNFLKSNKDTGAFGIAVDESNISLADVGDLIQISFDGESFEHSVVVYRKDGSRIYVASHTHNRLDYALDNYECEKIRLIHILGYGE